MNQTLLQWCLTEIRVSHLHCLLLRIAARKHRSVQYNSNSLTVSSPTPQSFVASGLWGSFFSSTLTTGGEPEFVDHRGKELSSLFSSSSL